MPDRFVNRILRLLISVLVLCPGYTFAQVNNLYRVELLVFSYPVGGASEQWDATPELGYPRTTQLLLYPGEHSASELRSADASASVVQAPTIFTPLPSVQREFGAKAAAMQSSGRYRILFHEAWIQPIAGKSAAIPIVLDRSGDGGPWPALQGTIKLYLSRYFYLDTNLWLNTQGEYLPGTWRMPPPPRGPASPVNTATESIATESPAAAESTVLSTRQPGAALAEEVVESDYPFRHAVLLKQSRRMRSGQLNYIDHPMLGVLVKISPLSKPESDSIDNT
ncbi:MAG: CsiV family protein [Halioglobus sp.]